MIRFEGTLINKKYIGYVTIKQAGYNDPQHILEIRFMNDNKYEAWLRFNYRSKSEAENALDKLEKLLNE